MNISKELLSEVLEFNVDNITTIDSVNIKQLLIIGDKCININIYELAFMCKSWANKKGYALTPMNDFGFDNNDVNNFKTYWTTCYINLQPVNGTHLHSELADTEPEAIFKATSYIMEQLKQKD